MVHKGWMGLIERYTFVDKAEIIGANVYIRYKKGDKEKFKKVPIRATGDQIQTALERIKKDIGARPVELSMGKYYII